MSQDNKQVVARWFKEFWGNPWNPRIVDELGTPDIVVHYPMHEPKKGRAVVNKFMNEFREAFPDLNFWGVGDRSRKATMWSADGKAAARIPARRSVISGWVRFGCFWSGRCGSPEQPSFVSKMAASQRNLAREDAITAMQQLGLISA